MKLYFLIFLGFFSSCAHDYRDSDRTQYQTDPERIRNDARQPLIPSDTSTQANVYSEDNLKSAQRDGSYGLSLQELRCKKTEIAFDLIGTLIGHPDYNRCVEYEYSYWLKLNWACESEKDHFIKNKTLALTSQRPQLKVLNAYNKELEPLPFTITTKYETIYNINRKTYENLDRVVFKAGNQSLEVKRSALSFTILIPDSICNGKM